MKFTCEKSSLQSAVSVSSRAVAQKSTITALEGILLTAQNDLLLTGYNLSLGIRTTVPADVIEPGRLVLSAHLFSDIVRRLPDDIVSISTNKNMVNIKCGMSEYNIMGTDPEEFPDLPVVEYEHALELPRVTLRSMINQTIFAVSTSEARPVHTGCLFEVNEENVLTMVCVDGFRLALRREQAKTTVGQPGYVFIVPATALKEVESICGESEEAVHIALGVNHVQFKVGNIILVSRRLEGEFLNYRNSMPAQADIVVRCNKHDLQRTIERVSLIITEKQKSPIRCQFGNNVVKIWVSTALGDARDQCEISGNGGDLEIGFNNKYMLDALKATPAEKVRVLLNSAVSPCVIVPSDEQDNSFLYLVLPVRIRAGQ